MIAWARRMSFRARLGVLVAIAVGVTLALGSLASYLAVDHQLYSQVDSTLQGEFGAVAPNGFFNADSAARSLRHFNNSMVQVNEANGTPVQLASNPDGPYFPWSRSLTRLALRQNGYEYRTITFEGQPYRVLAEPATLSALGGAPLYGVIQIARPLTDIEHSLSDLRLILWLVCATGVAVAIGLGYLVGKATIRPVERLTEAAEHVTATQSLDARIDDSGDDELARLGRSFNEMLAALALSRRQQAQLVSDAGHELRTPLTSLRTNIEVLLRVPDLPDADRAALMSDVRGQLEELTTLIGDVVELAREDEQQSDPIEVRFDAIVDQAAQRARRRAPGLTFETHLTPGSVRAQPALLERAVLNVLDNAAKWSPTGGTVTVWLQRGDRWTLDVRDDGPGIAREDLPHVFERFYRAEAARSLPGSGLGLAIVHQVVTAHGGTVSAHSPDTGGTVIHIELPTVAEAEPDVDATADGAPPAHAAGRSLG